MLSVVFSPMNRPYETIMIQYVWPESGVHTGPTGFRLLVASSEENTSDPDIILIKTEATLTCTPSLPAAHIALQVPQIVPINKRPNNFHKAYAHAIGIKVTTQLPAVTTVHATVGTGNIQGDITLWDDAACQESQLICFDTLIALPEEVGRHMLSLVNVGDSKHKILQSGSFFVGNIYSTDGQMPYFNAATIGRDREGAMIGNGIVCLKEDDVMKLDCELDSILEITAQFSKDKIDMNRDSALWLTHETRLVWNEEDEEDEEGEMMDIDE